MNNRGSSFAIFFLLLVGFACDGSSRIGGKVVDVNGQPVEGASVSFEEQVPGEKRDHHECRTTTTSSGSFGCGLTHAPWNVKFKLTVTKDGYKSFEHEYWSKDLQKSPGGNMGSQVITLEHR